MKENAMKTNKLILVAATVTAAFTLSNPALAQFKPETDDGIAASPKVRQMLDERNAHRATASHLAVVSRPAENQPSVTASPKLKQALVERGSDMNRNAMVASTPSTTASAKDGIAASPKLRQQLDERGTQFQIAPIK